MPKQVEFNGVIHEFPDDFSDEDIRAALSEAPDTSGDGLRAVIQQRDLSPNPDQPARPSVMRGREPAAVSKADWDALPLQQKMERFGKWAGNSLSGMMGAGDAGIDAVEHPTATLASAAIPLVAGKVPRLLGLSKARAGQNIQTATQAAKAAPVNVERVGQAGLRAMDLQAAGASMPRAATQFMRRITDPNAAELTFSEARDYYSNLSRLSANEFGRLNPTMQRQIAAMRQALHEALTESAGTVGQGSRYASGIREYARSSQATETGKKIAKVGAGAIGVGVAGNYALDKVLDALARTSGSR